MTFTTTVGRHTRPLALRLQLFTLAAAAAWSTNASPTFARTEVVAREGDTIPLPGKEMKLRGYFGAPVLNDHGQVAFRAFFDPAMPGSLFPTQAAITGTPGALRVVTYSGDPVPPNLGNSRTVTIGAPVLNNAGDIAVSAEFGVYGHATGTLLSWNSHGLVAVSEAGNPTAGTNPGIETYVRTESVLLNDAGQLLFALDTKFGRVLMASTPNGLVTIAKKGLPAPGTEPGTEFSYVSHEDHAINNLGQIAYLVDLRGNSIEGQTALYFGDIGSEHALVARTGDPLPGASDGALIGYPGSPSLNDRGEVAFAAELFVPKVDSEELINNLAIIAGRPGELSVVARDGDPAPGAGEGVNFRETVYPVINDSGMVAFRTRLAGAGINYSNDEAYYVGLPSELSLVAREGGQADGQTIGSLVGANISKLSNTAALNGSGQVAFNSEGEVWTGDGIDLVRVVGRGDPLEHGAVDWATIRTYMGGSDGRTSSLNELGQIVYTVEFTNHIEAVNLFTPELSWRGTEGDNQWDSHRNWTLSLSPGRVHDVSIGSESDLHILGPSADVTVKSLVVGEDNVPSKLELQANSVLTALEDFRIEANGTVAGNGKIAAELVHNDGLIDIGNSPGDLIVDGNFVQTDDGILRIEITDEGAFDSLNVTGTAVLDGSIEVMLDPDFAPRNGMHWDILSAESISLIADVTHPAGLNVELLADQFGSIDVLRVWSAPEPGTMATMIVGIGLVIAACGGRRSRRAGC